MENDTNKKYNYFDLGLSSFSDNLPIHFLPALSAALFTAASLASSAASFWASIAAFYASALAISSGVGIS